MVKPGATPETGDGPGYLQRLEAERLRPEQIASAHRHFAEKIEIRQYVETSLREDAQRRISALEAEVATLHRQVQSVYGSTSWRLTGPMRRLVRLAKRLRGRWSAPATGQAHNLAYDRQTGPMRRLVRLAKRLRGRWSAPATGQAHNLAYDRQTAAIVTNFQQGSIDFGPPPLHLALGSDAALTQLLATRTERDDTPASTTPASYSIVTPFHQHLGFFRACAESVAALLQAMGGQAVARCQWVVVNDDASVPDQLLLDQLPPALAGLVTLVSDGRNHGIANALNRGVQAARHPWLLFLDCDDIIEPSATAVLDNAIAAAPRCRYFSSAMIDIGEDGAELRRRRQEHPPAALFERGMVMGHLMAVRRDLYDELGGFDPQFSGAQDYDLALRAALREPLRQLPEYLYRYRWHASSQSVKRPRRQDRLQSAIRASVVRHALAAPPLATPVAELPAVPRSLCVIRTMGTRLELLAAAVASVRQQALPMLPCVVVHGDAEAHAQVGQWLAEGAPGPMQVLHAPDTSRKRGYPCNVALRFLREHAGDFDLLCFLDDDDHLLPDFAARLVAALRLNGADMAYCQSNALPDGAEPRALHRALPAVALFHRNFIPNNAFLVRTELLVRTPSILFREDLHYLEDWDFLVQLMDAGMRVVPVFETLSEFRLIGDGNAAVKQDPEHFEYCQALVRRHGQQAAAKRPIGEFWRDVIDFPNDQYRVMNVHDIADLLAAKVLFAAGDAP